MTRYVQTNDAIFKIVDGQAVVLSPMTPDAFHLNVAGTYLWTLLETERSFDEIASALALRYQVDASRAQQDCCAFLEALDKRGLLSCRIS